MPKGLRIKNESDGMTGSEAKIVLYFSLCANILLLVIFKEISDTIGVIALNVVLFGGGLLDEWYMGRRGINKK